MSTDLREILASHLDDIVPPAGDLAAATRRGRTIRRRRRGGLLAASALTVAAVALMAVQVVHDDGTPGRSDPTGPAYRTVAAFDVANGLRAFADPAPDGLINLGDKSYTKKDMDYLDTDASATPYGMVFFDKDQKPRMLGHDGKVVELGDGPPTPVKGFHPSSKIDSQRPWVTWTENHGTFVRVVVYDLSGRSVVSTRELACTGKTCATFKVDGLDGGDAFVRTPEGTFIWQVDDNVWTQLGGPKLRVADVRHGTILWADAAPTMAPSGWRYVKGAIDAQLTYDGKNILYWSNRLEPIAPGGRAIQLDAGSRTDGWYTIDTDGSVLVAVTTKKQTMTNPVLKADVFDCEIPSGACTKIGAIATESGDPMFIGDDM